jgi:hypothetical protein
MTFARNIGGEAWWHDKYAVQYAGRKRVSLADAAKMEAVGLMGLIEFWVGSVDSSSNFGSINL